MRRGSVIWCENERKKEKEKIEEKNYFNSILLILFFCQSATFKNEGRRWEREREREKNERINLKKKIERKVPPSTHHVLSKYKTLSNTLLSELFSFLFL